MLSGPRSAAPAAATAWARVSRPSVTASIQRAGSTVIVIRSRTQRCDLPIRLHSLAGVSAPSRLINVAIAATSSLIVRSSRLVFSMSIASITAARSRSRTTIGTRSSPA